MKNRFWLIQRGKLNKDGGPNLMGREGVVKLDYMGSAEFEWGALPYSLWRIMHEFEEYTLFDSGISVVGNRKLLVFSKKANQKEIAEALQSFVKEPYRLKEWSNLEKLVQVADITKPASICYTRFWWCIDKNECGQWMAFLEEDSERIYAAIQHDYHNWWLVMPEEERLKKYEEARKNRW